MPIHTPRLLIRPKVEGDGALTSVAVAETWTELQRWMQWAEDLTLLTAERIEERTRQLMASFPMGETVEFIGMETASGLPVVWCGFHDIDWEARQCDTGFWVRKSAHGRGFATEAANALLRYAFGALGMQRVGLTHSRGNEASGRIAEKLGFTREGVQAGANRLPGGRLADRFCYARFDAEGLPDLDVRWDGG
ncbi:MAG TPA: GNAT family protein [Silvibacterium sp.]|nr:GNAT family protein [Silvibacterium sp.]